MILIGLNGSPGSVKMIRVKRALLQRLEVSLNLLPCGGDLTSDFALAVQKRKEQMEYRYVSGNKPAQDQESPFVSFRKPADLHFNSLPARAAYIPRCWPRS